MGACPGHVHPSRLLPTSTTSAVSAEATVGLSRPAPRVAATSHRRPAGSARPGSSADTRNAVSSPGVYGETGTCLRIGSPTGPQPSPRVAWPTRRRTHRLSSRYVLGLSALTWLAQYSTFSGTQQPNIDDTARFMHPHCVLGGGAEHPPCHRYISRLCRSNPAAHEGQSEGFEVAVVGVGGPYGWSPYLYPVQYISGQVGGERGPGVAGHSRRPDCPRRGTVPAGSGLPEPFRNPVSRGMGVLY